MISDNFEPKITRFDYVRLMTDDISEPKTTNIESVPNMDDIINWMAPEKIENFDLYDTKCEMFRYLWVFFFVY